MLDAALGVRGRLEAEFVSDGSGTKARVSAAVSPLELRGPFSDHDVSRFYLRNVTCGVLEGDRYEVHLSARPGARAFVSASSATKVHAMRGPGATTEVRMESSTGAVLAYHDGPTILQHESDLTQRVEIVAGEGLAVYAEVIVFGRLARGETLGFRRYRSELVVRDGEGRTLYIERYDLSPSSDRLSIAEASLPVLGKVIAVGATVESSLNGLELSSDCLVAGCCDTLPSGAGLVLRVGGARLEPVSRLIESAFSVALACTERRELR